MRSRHGNERFDCVCGVVRHRNTIARCGKLRQASIARVGSAQQLMKVLLAFEKDETDPSWALCALSSDIKLIACRQLLANSTRLDVFKIPLSKHGYLGYLQIFQLFAMVLIQVIECQS